jgi:hypothetical protein
VRQSLQQLQPLCSQLRPRLCDCRCAAAPVIRWAYPACGFLLQCPAACMSAASAGRRSCLRTHTPGPLAGFAVQQLDWLCWVSSVRQDYVHSQQCAEATQCTDCPVRMRLGHPAYSFQGMACFCSRRLVCLLMLASRCWAEFGSFAIGQHVRVLRLWPEVVISACWQQMDSAGLHQIEPDAVRLFKTGISCSSSKVWRQGSGVVCVCTLTQHNQLAPFFGQARV